MVQGSCGAGRMVCRRVWCSVLVQCGVGQVWCRQVYCRASVVQASVVQLRCGCRLCRSVVQASVVQQGAGQLWCREHGVQAIGAVYWCSVLQGECGAGECTTGRVWCGRVWCECAAGQMWCTRMWCRAAVVQGECGVAESGAVWCRASGAVWCRTSSGVRCRAGVVQASVVQCGAGREWCRAWCRTRFRAWCAGRVWCRVDLRAGAVQTNVVHANVVQPYLDGGWCMRVWFHVVQYQGPH